MAIKTRADLKGQFSNGIKLNQAQFYDLIDSMLNKRDDSFMGKWRQGAVYRTGNVVIHNQALWEVKPDSSGNPVEICACSPPGEGEEWQTLIVPQQDDDWVHDLETGVMYAKVFRCVGIGRAFDPLDDPPDAKLEVVTDHETGEDLLGRFLIFPKPAESPTLSLVQVGNETERMNAFFLFGVNNQEAALTTDAPSGFVFRHQGHSGVGKEDELDFRDGDVLMVIEPAEAGSGNARVGISTKSPKAMLDVTDRRKGRFLISPDDKEDPVFTILNLDPESNKNYTATGVGVDYSIFISDAPKGFLFKRGEDYGLHCQIAHIDQGDSLMVIRQGKKGNPQVGIGTEDPCAMLNVTDGEKGAFIFDPEVSKDPVFTVVNLQLENKKNYLTSGMGKERATMVTNAEKGFQFKAGKDIKGDCPTPDLDKGKRLVVILPNGNTGIGTESYDPTVRLEITDEKSGKFLFNLDDIKVNPALGIVNTRPGSVVNYFTIGADNQTAVLVTDSKNGFAFKQGEKSNDNEVDVTQGDILLRLLPHGGEKHPAQAVFFPDIKGKIGILRNPGDFQLDLNGLMRAYSIFIDTDQTNLSKEQKLEKYFEQKGYGTAVSRLMSLIPIAFEWDKQAIDYSSEGKQFGFKAQEVQDIMVELVKENSNDHKLSVNYPGMMALLVKSIQEQQKTIEDLKTRVEALENSGENA
jgi:hypothetical protein